MKKTIWPWAIAIIYGAFMLALIGYLLFSFTQDVDLVKEDYYEDGIQYQLEIDRMTRTAKLDHSLTWQFDKTSRRMTISYPDAAISGTIHFFRPSDADLDRKYPLNLSSDGRQEIDLNMLAEGLWRIKIFWQAEKTDYYTEGMLVLQ